MRADPEPAAQAAPRDVAHAKRYAALAGFAGAFVLLVGAFAAIGWAIDAELLLRLRARFVAIAPSTAVGFVLAGLALLLVRPASPSAARNRAARVAAAAVVAIGVAALTERWLGLNHAVLRRLVPRVAGIDDAIALAAPASVSGAAFLLAGSALLLLAVRLPRRFRVADVLSLATGFLAIQALVGYVYDVEAFYADAAFRPMAVHSAVAFLVLAFGILFARPDRGLTRTLVADDAGGYLARRLLPAAIVIPFLLGLFRVAGVEAGLFGLAYGVTIVIVLSMVVIVTLVWWVADVLHRLDVRRTEAEAERRGALAEAERRRGELQELLESRSRLMRGFSHDVRNPLGAADGQLAMLQEGVLDGPGPRQRAAVDRARGSVRKAMRLIDTLVELARAEAGPLEAGRAPTDVRGVAHEVAEEYRAAAEGKGLSIDLVLPKTLPLIRSDVDRIRQILGNLVTNAVKYTERGGITVRVEQRERDGGPGAGPWIAVHVADTGPGIPRRHHDAIFGEFSRIAAGGKRGAGLGLAISRRLARLLGGDVTLESEPGRGSTFTLWLPRDGAPGTGSTGPARQTTGGARSADGGEREGGGPHRRGEPDGRGVVLESSLGVDSPEWPELLLDQLEDYAVFLVDKAGRIIRWNRGSEKTTGYSAAEVLGRRFSIFYPQAEIDAGKPETEMAIATETGRYEEERWRYKADGTPFYANEILVPIRDRHGRHVGFGKIFQDVSDRRRTERERERLLAGQRLLADASATLASTLDYPRALEDLVRMVVERIADWSVLHVHHVEADRFRRSVGAHGDPAKQPILEAYLRFDIEPSARTPILEVFRTRQSLLLPRVDESTVPAITGDDPEQARILRELGVGSAMFVPLVARDRTFGVLAIVSSESGRVYDDDDLALAEELGHRAAIVIDNARLYQAAAAASGAKSEFLALMSHELRTPLTAIIGYEEMLEGGIAGPVTEQQAAYLRRIRAGAMHLHELIEEILTFSRLEAGREVVHLERADVDLLARETADVVVPAAREKGLRFYLDIPDSPVEIETDPRKLRRILLNLLNNSVSFTDRGGIRLTLERADRGVVLRVEDTGIGIAPEAVERVFEPFWQEQRGLTREIAGTGLGLTVARRLARMLGGDITVTSEVGRGSAFTVRIPDGGA